MVYGHSDRFEVTLKPQPVYNGRNVIARNSDFKTFLKTGQLYDLIRSEIAVALDSNSADYIFFRVVIIYRNSSILLLSHHWHHRCAQQHCQEDHSANFHLLNLNSKLQI